MGYTGRAVACSLATVAIVWVAFTNHTLLPAWLVASAGLAAALTFATAVRNIRNWHYYEGPRSALVVDPRAHAVRGPVPAPRSRHGEHAEHQLPPALQSRAISNARDRGAVRETRRNHEQSAKSA